jgi:hypothetical protein
MQQIAEWWFLMEESQVIRNTTLKMLINFSVELFYNINATSNACYSKLCSIFDQFCTTNAPIQFYT